MLGPAVNRQPGFRRGTRRAKQRREDQPRWLAGWLAGWLPACLPVWLAAGSERRLARPGRLADRCWPAGRLAGWLLVSFLTGWLTGWLAGSLDLAGSVAVLSLTALPGCVDRCMLDCLNKPRKNTG